MLTIKNMYRRADEVQDNWRRAGYSSDTEQTQRAEPYFLSRDSNGTDAFSSQSINGFSELYIVF